MKPMKSIAIIALTITVAMANPKLAATEFEQLKENQQLSDFAVEALYENQNGQLAGARFRHTPSGFILDLMRIQSVPQAFMWVNSSPPSDQGEPHTCEHLLLGKGTRGRYVASLEDMSVGRSSAFTRQMETCYHFHTAAGSDVFFDLLYEKLNAMLHPNFSDEEIRREVCNIGYAISEADSSMRLEEKGTVYNEMVSSYERPWGNLYRELDLLLYGAGHPLSNDAGGLPSAIRTMTPDNLRSFHTSTHHLNNMGMIVSIPDAVSIDQCLKQISSIFERVEPDVTTGDDPGTAYDRLPTPSPAEFGTIRLVGFPHQNENEPGLLVCAWPPLLDVDESDRLLLSLLVDNVASGETSNLYRKFIDSESRVIDIGADAVFAWVSSFPGAPVYVGISNVKRESLEEAAVDSVRNMVAAEFAAVGNLADGSPELAQFNQRLLNRVIERKREISKFLNSPPGFGFRGTSARWLTHLMRLERLGGFRRQLALNEQFAQMEQMMAGDHNIWTELLNKWGMLKYKPYVVATRPDPELLEASEADRKGRIEQFSQTLEKKYGLHDRSAVLARYRREYDEQTAVIDKEAATIEMPRFVDAPPMTLDDQLKYSVQKLPGGGDLVVSTFDNLSGGTIGLAFALDVVPESLLVYLSLLPSLLTDVGVIMDGRSVSYTEMAEAVRREILGLYAYYSVNYHTQRVELVVRASGATPSETSRALDWLSMVLSSANWRPDNLPRLRDAVDAGLSSLSNRMRGSEESWVNDPVYAFQRQTNPLLLSAGSFLTRKHAAHRLRWKLKEVGSPAEADQVADFLNQVSTYAMRMDRKQSEEMLIELLDDLSSDRYSLPDSVDRPKLSLTEDASSGSLSLAKDAIEDLQYLLSDIPDASLAGDIAYLCSQMEADLRQPATDALKQVAYVVDLIRNQHTVRGFLVAGSQVQEELKPRIDQLVSRFSDLPVERQQYSTTPIVTSRLQERDPSATDVVFVGLVNQNTRSGVHLNLYPCASFVEQDDESLLTFLSARLYGGGGAHSMFMKTWGAGLAYSNGLRANEATGNMIYYAERCPDLAQTMQFVVSELNRAPYDSSLADYAVAQAFTMFRSASSYERRGESMAADLADGITPDAVRGFREGILRLYQTADLYDQIQGRMQKTYGAVLPGYGPTAAEYAKAQYYVIGPESQLESYEKYLKHVEGSDARLHSLYPRDYWIVR
ncbi:MAG: hypothetical protein ACE5FH_06935 [Candidatus Zixiibacteriota bacterium]